jgi:hypothetical protein
MSSLVVIHPVNNTCTTVLKQGYILILRRLNRWVITTSPNSRHGRLLAGGVLLLKSNKEYVLTFNILAQVLVDYHF